MNSARLQSNGKYLVGRSALIRRKKMSVTIISNEDLKKLNDGKTVDLDFGPVSVTIASEKWVERMEKLGNIKDSKHGKVVDC